MSRPRPRVGRVSAVPQMAAPPGGSPGKAPGMAAAPSSADAGGAEGEALGEGGERDTRRLTMSHGIDTAFIECVDGMPPSVS